MFKIKAQKSYRETHKNGGGKKPTKTNQKPRNLDQSGGNSPRELGIS